MIIERLSSSPLARHIQTAVDRFRNFGVFESVVLRHAGRLLNGALTEGPEYVDGLSFKQKTLLYNYSSMICLRNEVFSVVDDVDQFSFGPFSQLSPRPAEQRFFRGHHFEGPSDEPASSIEASLSRLIGSEQFPVRTTKARVLNICGGTGSLLESVSKYFTDSDLDMIDPNWMNIDSAIDRFSKDTGSNRFHLWLGDPRKGFNGIPYTSSVFDLILLGKEFDRGLNYEDIILLFQSVVRVAKYGSAMMLVETDNPERLRLVLEHTNRRYIFPTNVYTMGPNIYLGTSESTNLFERFLCCKTDI